MVADSAGYYTAYLNPLLSYDIVITDSTGATTYASYSRAGSGGGGSNDVHIVVDTLAELQAFTGQDAEDVIECLGRASAGDGYYGKFRWVTGDQSANITADTTSAIWVGPDSDDTGASGAWKRIYEGAIHLDWFGGGTDTAAQAAIDFLPTTGGEIALDGGSYTGITPSNLTVAEDKMIRWVLYGDATAPSDLTGMQVSQGLRNQPNAASLGGGTRPGSAFYNFVVTHDVKDGQANQQDSVIYVEGVATPEGSETSLTTEFAGFRANMQIVGGEPVGEGIRAAHYTVFATGGHAKIRGVRATVGGEDGHDGLVTAALFTATRSGEKPGGGGDYASGDAGPYPNEDAAIIGAVGPGIRRVFSAVGQSGKERPQIAWHQSGGNQAILPEVAVIYMHGGGNGDLVQVWDDEDAGTEIATWEKDGTLAVPALRSNVNTITLADDASGSYDLVRSGGFIMLHSPGSSNIFAIIGFRAVAASEVASSIHEGAGVDVTTGPLTGTSGVDGQVTVSIDDQTLVIENRSGATRTFNYTVV
ncbi:MAG: hypothetical protein AAFY24_01845 [Pseudomonadota bacterium]